MSENNAVQEERDRWIARLLNLKLDLQDRAKTKQQIIRIIEQHIREAREAKIPEVSRASHYS
jgi:hypothetical protein